MPAKFMLSCMQVSLQAQVENCSKPARPHLGEQGVVQPLHQVGVLHVTTEELGVLHAERVHVCAGGSLELVPLIVWVEALPALLCTVPA